MYEVSPGGDEWRWTTDLIEDGGTEDLDGVLNNGKVRIQIVLDPKFVEVVPASSAALMESPSLPFVEQIWAGSARFFSILVGGP